MPIIGILLDDKATHLLNSFWSASSPKIKRICIVYSALLENVGYCTGMNRYTARIRTDFSHSSGLNRRKYNIHCYRFKELYAWIKSSPMAMHQESRKFSQIQLFVAALDVKGDASKSHIHNTYIWHRVLQPQKSTARVWLFETKIFHANMTVISDAWLTISVV